MADKTDTTKPIPENARDILLGMENDTQDALALFEAFSDLILLGDPKMIESPLDNLMIIARQKVEVIEEKRLKASSALHAEERRIVSIA